MSKFTEEEVPLTPEEIQGDGFGHTDWVQPTRSNDLNATEVGGTKVQHRWVQYGNEAVCDGTGHPKHATILHPMEMIVKEDDGSYVIKPVPVLQGI